MQLVWYTAAGWYTNIVSDPRDARISDQVVYLLSGYALKKDEIFDNVNQ